MKRLEWRTPGDAAWEDTWKAQMAGSSSQWVGYVLSIARSWRKGSEEAGLMLAVILQGDGKMKNLVSSGDWMSSTL